MAHPTSCLLLLFLLGAVPAFARDFWNIDCGGNVTFVNANNLTFEGDAPYIRTGISREAPDADKNEIPREIATLRAFPPAPWKKSCYRVPVEQGTKVLVRVQFYYGNYDGLNSPPAFYVRFDTSEFCSVTTVSDLKSWSYCEVVYVTTMKQGTDICFLRTNDDQSPIVSTIEVRRLPRNMYDLLDFSSHALFMKSRFAFGANETIGYPYDAYNRNWKPNDLQRGPSKAVIVKRQSMTPVNTSRLTDAPPALLFQAAVVAPMLDNHTAGNLTIRTPWRLSEPSNIYFTMYYAEMASAAGLSSQHPNRTFQLFMDGESLHSNLIPTEIGVAYEFSSPMYKASNETVFDLVPAEGSTLPPAISGMEVFLIHGVDNATDSNDVATLSMLQSNFTVFENWTGDPCRPTDSPWEWVRCKYPDDNSSPRINKLYLSGYQLSGNIIPNFSALDALEVVDLSNNNFTGSVPEFLASLPKLQTLDLANNNFDSIPPSWLNNSNITLITRGNPHLELPDPSTQGAAPGSASTNGCNKVAESKLVLFLCFFAATAIVLSDLHRDVILARFPLCIC